MSNDPPVLNVVLFEPEIPGNTGAIGRTCLAIGAKLWLVRPLGFQVDEKTLRRAGLDYWQHLNWEVANHWDDLLEKLEPRQMWKFTRFAERAYDAVKYEKGDTLLFGSESRGLPKRLTVATPESNLRIPTSKQVRSLNLSCSVGVACFEAVRQFRSSGVVSFDL